jgi:hypothetical protein
MRSIKLPGYARTKYFRVSSRLEQESVIRNQGKNEKQRSLQQEIQAKGNGDEEVLHRDGACLEHLLTAELVVMS